MSQPGGAFKPGRVPRGGVGTLVLIVLIEMFAGQRTVSLLDSTDLDWKTTSRLATRRAAKCDILCFGDSMVKFGIAPKVLEAALKRPTYNLAMLDGKPAASYFQFRRALAAGARPSAVLVDYSPEAMFQPPWHLFQNPRWNELMLDPIESFDVAWNYGMPDLFARFVLARAFPTIRCRGQVRAHVLAALNGRDDSTREGNAPIRRNWQVNHGGILLARQPGFQGDVSAEFGCDLLNPQWRSEPDNSRYVERFLKLAQARDIPVFWIVPPNANRVLAFRREHGLAEPYSGFIRRAMDRFSNLRVIDARDSAFSDQVFVDPVHLDRQGASVLTTEVAGVLRRTLTPGPPVPRWVTLGPYRESPALPPLEDVEQSRAALKLDLTRARR